ncbi:hypothetical protein L6164_029859 [Bauhinia variegata]|uniref:Uncharacterized protein n=1 Tax=Bauhinia variegata TaxID=167791 RepID=A0ACB9LBW1_BAUVA|nr:hypothetical protein L6164_029859 [Bauhinia variegata]
MLEVYRWLPMDRKWKFSNWLYKQTRILKSRRSPSRRSELFLEPEGERTQGRRTEQKPRMQDAKVRFGDLGLVRVKGLIEEQTFRARP